MLLQAMCLPLLASIHCSNTTDADDAHSNAREWFMGIPCLACVVGPDMHLPHTPLARPHSTGFLNAPGIQLFIAKVFEGNEACIGGCCDTPDDMVTNALLRCKQCVMS